MDDRLMRPVAALKDRSLLTDKAYVGGRWRGAEGGKIIPVTDPFDGSVIAHVPDFGVDVVREAIDAAAVAQVEWARRSAKRRAAVLRRWYELIVENADDLAQILTAEQGKPLGEAKGEILSNDAYLEWFGEEAKRIDGDIISGPNRSQRVMVLKQPVGVCAAITPWNFPNGMITRKAGPVLPVGCSMILKPAAQTPLSAFALAVLAERAGVPVGVFSVVTGEARSIGMEFCHNPKVAKITFRDEDEVVAMANDSEFGLASYFYARDLGRVWRVAEALEAGMVGVNTGTLANEMAPFGGVKQSGIGREGSSYGIEGFLELKYVAVAGI